MQTDTITLTCSNNAIGTDNTCTTSSWFSGGEFFISLCLVIGILIAIINMTIQSVFAVKIHKKFLGVNSIEGKEIYKI
jgi:hypothetical protein